MKKKIKVCIVGGGPVGLTLGLFLQKFRVPFKIFEMRDHSGFNHPKAHYINSRSMEILSEINGLDHQIYSAAENFNNFRHYRYQRRLFDTKGLYHVTDHFAPKREIIEANILKKCWQLPVHMPQNLFTDILFSRVNKDSYSGKSCVVGFSRNSSPTTPSEIKLLTAEGEEYYCEILVLANGFRSQLRDYIGGISLAGPIQNESMQFKNIYFQSKELAKKLMLKNENAMLHFIYNSNIVAVLVSHSYERGEFVLQVPIMYYDMANDRMPDLELIKLIIDEGETISDIKICHSGKWFISNCMVNKFSDSNIFLAGDAAHAVPPSGGFGMNLGIQDAHSLAHKLAKVNSAQYSVEHASAEYNHERAVITAHFMNISQKYFEMSQRIAKYLKLDFNHLTYLHNFSDAIPAPENFKSFFFFYWKKARRIAFRVSKIIIISKNQRRTTFIFSRGRRFNQF